MQQQEYHQNILSTPVHNTATDASASITVIAPITLCSQATLDEIIF